MYYIKKTNRFFTNKQSVINHIRSIYKNTHEAYINEISGIIPKCEYCNNDCTFAGYFSGYSNRCQSDGCRQYNLERGYRKQIASRIYNKKVRSQSASEFLEFLHNNIDWYKENIDKCGVIDLFTQKTTGDLTLYGYLRRCYNENIFIDIRNCKFCDHTYRFNILKTNSSKECCNSKKCRNLRLNGYNNQSTIFDNSKDLNNFILSNNLDRKQCKGYAKNANVWSGTFKLKITPDTVIFDCPVTGWKIPLNNKSNVLVRFLKRHQIDVEEYFRKYLSDHKFQCKFCGREDFLRRTSGNSNVLKAEFCNKDCFISFKKNNPELYQRSVESIEQQSTTMKNLIASGKFTPCITNSWTHWSAVIELDSGEIRKFRSSWEACFWFCNQHLEYETLRIPYTNIVGKISIYIADFFDRNNSILYEIRPIQNWNNKNCKTQATINYCLNNNIKFVWINEHNILNYIDQSKFVGNNLLQLNKLNGIKTNKNKKNNED